MGIQILWNVNIGKAADISCKSIWMLLLFSNEKLNGYRLKIRNELCLATKPNIIGIRNYILFGIYDDPSIMETIPQPIQLLFYFVRLNRCKCLDSVNVVMFKSFVFKKNPWLHRSIAMRVEMPQIQRRFGPNKFMIISVVSNIHSIKHISNSIWFPLFMAEIWCVATMVIGHDVFAHLMWNCRPKQWPFFTYEKLFKLISVEQSFMFLTPTNFHLWADSEWCNSQSSPH